MKTILLMIVFGLAGTLLEHHDVITEPAYWALYGAVFGAVGTFVSVEEAK